MKTALMSIFLRMILLLSIVMMNISPVLAYESSHSSPNQIGSPFLSEDIQNLEKLKKLQGSFPGAEFRSVTAEEYQRLVRQSRVENHPQQSLQLAASADFMLQAIDEETKPKLRNQTRKHLSEQESDACGKSISSQDENLFGSMSGLGGGSGDGAAIILVIIGIIVVAVLVIYTVKYMFDVLTSTFSCSFWFSLTTTANNITKSHSSSKLSGNMAGIRLTTGAYSRQSHLGLSAEIGGYNFTQTAIAKTHKSGAYWVAGPVLHIGSSQVQKAAFSLEILGGRTINPEPELISMVRMNITTMISKAYLGFNAGVLYMGIADDAGLAKDIDNYTTFLGLELGYKF